MSTTIPASASASTGPVSPSGAASSPITPPGVPPHEAMHSYTIRESWDFEQWRQQREAHEQRIDELTRGHRERRERGEKHAIEDFLFTYYNISVGKIRRWHPGPGVELLASPEESADFLATGMYVWTGRGITVDTAQCAQRKRSVISRARTLLRLTADRAPFYGCFGLHEWAMVYKLGPEDVRHSGLGLRLSHERTDEVVENGALLCTHFDAFRFFTSPAVPRNRNQLSRENQPDYEQPGCLHANMDLYRWSASLLPLVPSELVADCFELARDIRYLDMQASPYDVSGFGLDAVEIETPAGRAEYVRRQRGFSARAQGLRERLLTALSSLEA